MNSKAIGALVILLALWGGWALYEYWLSYKNESESGRTPVPAIAVVSADQLGRLPDRLENELAEAQREGATGLRRFLQKYQKSPALKDPRKAWIQLDYVVMASLTDPAEAKRVYREVQKRIGPDSPVYERVKKLQRTYE